MTTTNPLEDALDVAEELIREGREADGLQVINSVVSVLENILAERRKGAGS